MNVTIVGAGAWGTALAISLAANHRVTLWARNTAQIEAMRITRYNQHYLPDILLPDDLKLDSDFSAALATAELAIVAVPLRFAPTDKLPVRWRKHRKPYPSALA